LKILLIAPPDNKFVPPFDSLPTKPTPIFSGFPLGLGYLAASLITNKYQVKILDCLSYGFGLDQIATEVKSYRPDIVGITTMTHYIKSAVATAKLVKGLNPKIKIIGGGPHAHFDFTNLLQNYNFDYIVLGEGELTIIELVDQLSGKNKQPLKTIKGIAYKKQKNIIKTPPRPLIQNLDILPYPARDVVDFDYYIVDQLLPKAIEIVGSRGCSHRCAFCSSAHFWQMWRARSPENIVAEMKYLSQKYPRAKSFLFYDDNFTVNRKRVEQLCRLIIKAGLNRYQWNCQARADQVDADLLKLMKQAGVSKINYGLESASTKIIRNIDKKLKVADIKKAVGLTKKFGIEALVYMMVGNPGESPATIKTSVEFIKKLKPTSSLWSVAQILPGTKLHQLQPIKDYVNYLYQPEINHPYLYTWSFIPVFENKNLNREQTKQLHLKISRYFAFYHLITDPFSKLKHILVSPAKSLSYLLSLLNRP